MGVVTLVSGGLDSTLMSLMAHEEGITLFPLFVNYGQLGSVKEWEACKHLHERYNLPKVEYMDLSGYGKIIHSGITDSKLRINEDAFLPGRNLLFILVGAAYAIKVGADGVAIGLLNPAEHLFPDQTVAFTKQCENIVEIAMGKRIAVLTPLIDFSKSDILAMVNTRDIRDTYSCHAGGDTPCGLCVSCLEIANAKKRR